MASLLMCVGHGNGASIPLAALAGTRFGATPPPPAEQCGHQCPRVRQQPRHQLRLGMDPSLGPWWTCRGMGGSIGHRQPCPAPMVPASAPSPPCRPGSQWRPPAPRQQPQGNLLSSPGAAGRRGLTPPSAQLAVGTTSGVRTPLLRRNRLPPRLSSGWTTMVSPLEKSPRRMALAMGVSRCF